MMLIGAFIPFLELFDCWDAPGLSNDTEFPVYAFILVLCLVVLLCNLISSAALKLSFLFCRVYVRDDREKLIGDGQRFLFVVPPLSAIPLRI